MLDDEKKARATLGAGLSTLSFVNFEHFCGNVNRVERPESSICCEEVGKGAKNKTGQDT